MLTYPKSASSIPPIILRSVDFPEPDGPSSTHISPFSTSKLIPLRTSTLLEVLPYDFFKSFKQKDSLIHQLIHTTYYGTFFALKKDFYIRIRSKFLSNQKEPWDRRIGFIAKRNNEICFLNKKLIRTKNIIPPIANPIPIGIKIDKFKLAIAEI